MCFFYFLLERLSRRVPEGRGRRYLRASSIIYSLSFPPKSLPRPRQSSRPPLFFWFYVFFASRRYPQTRFSRFLAHFGLQFRSILLFFCDVPVDVGKKTGMNSDLVFSILEAAAMQQNTNESRNLFTRLPRCYYLASWAWLGWWGVAKRVELRSRRRKW